MRRRRSPWLAILLFAAVASPAAARGEFDTVIAFGDSLSDTGRVADMTFGLVPGEPYHAGRFSNGPVWSEQLAGFFGHALLPSTQVGGTNFAAGGAMTDESGFVPSLTAQVEEYLGRRDADTMPEPTEADLFLLWAGANDLLDGVSDPAQPATHVDAAVQSLASAGARHVLVPNLPWPGRVPAVANDPDRDDEQYDAMTQSFNAELSSRLAVTQASFADLRIYQFDVASLLNAAFHDPQAFGFTYADAAVPGLDPLALGGSDVDVPENVNDYIFFDDLHPTTAAHALLAEHARQTLYLPGDMNLDGVVDTADVAPFVQALTNPQAYEDQFGIAPDEVGDINGDGAFDTADVAPFVQLLVGGGSPSVPEPGSLALLGLGALALLRRGRAGGGSAIG